LKEKHAHFSVREEKKAIVTVLWIERLIVIRDNKWEELFVGKQARLWFRIMRLASYAGCKEAAKTNKCKAHDTHKVQVSEL
jgi:hypothetical protein